MDKERRKKIQATKLVITEIFMLITVVLTVVILTFIVMGYHLTDDGKLEQSGLVQVESIPTGATVTTDQEVLPAKTNTSKILPEGEHTVLLEKEGYTSWAKSFKTHPGFLTKLAYPRLYKISRTAETIEKLDEAPAFLSVSPNRNLLLYLVSGKLYSLNLESDTPKPAELALKKLFKTTVPADFRVLTWSENGERIIAAYTESGTPHFAIVDLTHPDYSLDLSTTFDLEISELAFITPNGDNLFILEDGHLRTIVLALEQLSSILVDKVVSFNNFGAKAVVVQNIKEISLYDYNTKKTISLKQSVAENPRALISEYLGRPTLVFAEDGQITVYRGELPTENVSKDNPLGEPVGKYTLDFGTPDVFRMVAKQAVVLTSKEHHFTIFDLETYSTSSYTLESDLTFWPDDYTIGEVVSGELIFRDFDGENRQVLGHAATGFPAVISKDNKYLYNLSKTYAITRENIK